MNPSYDSSGQNATGNSGIPGAKPGVIASGPDTPSPEVPVLDVGADSQNPNGVFAGLSRRPTGGRPTGNGMTGGPITPQPMDKIALDGGGGPKRSRKGLLIAGIALIGVALVAGIVALVVMGGGNNGSGKSTVDKTTALNNVTKYMLFGDVEDVNEISNVKLNDAMYVSVVMSQSYEEQQSYFGQANQYLETLQNADEKKDQMINNLVIDTTLLEKIAAFAYTDILWQSYLSEGQTGIQNYVDGITGLEVADDVDINIVEVTDGLVTTTIKVYTEYTKGGCIKDSVMDWGCAESMTGANASLAKMVSEMASLKLKLRRYVGELNTIIYNNLRAINGISEESQDELEVIHE